jgi:SnoaL-like polyketide cyclase
MSSAVGAPSTVQELAERYLQAWQDHDLEAILALQTEDSEFHLHGAGGVKSSVGIDVCRATYDYLLKAWPDQRFEVTGLTVNGNSYVGQSILTATLALPWEMGDKTYYPSGKSVSFEMVDIMQCEGNRIKLKNCWMDGVGLIQQLEAASA